MNIKKVFTLSVLLIIYSGVKLKSQQVSVNNFHNINKIVYNPANAHDKNVNIFLTSRQQWIGSNVDAPRTNLLGASKTIGVDQNMGVGFMFGYDTYSFLTRMSFKGMYSYRLPLSTEDEFFHNISFGLSVGMVQNKVDFQEVRTSEGENGALLKYLDDNIDGKPYFDAGFGLTYQYDDLILGLALPNIFQDGVVANTEIDIASGLMGFLFQASYDYSGEQIKIIPQLTYSNSSDKMHITEMNVSLATLDEGYWIRTGYRNIGHVDFLTLSAGIKFSDFRVAYCYEMNFGSISSINKSHEIAFNYMINNGDELGEEIYTGDDEEWDEAEWDDDDELNEYVEEDDMTEEEYQELEDMYEGENNDDEDDEEVEEDDEDEDFEEE